MNAQSASLSIAALTAAAVGACRFTSDKSIDWNTGPVPTPTFGSGRDGTVDVSEALVLDSCEPVDETIGSEIVLGSGADVIESGRLVLLLQVRDDVTAPVADANDLTAIGDSGRWEVGSISSVEAGPPVVLTLDSPPARNYSSSTYRAAQVCKMYEYLNLDVHPDGAVVASPWDGKKGGVLAILVKGDLRVRNGASISADDAGFRGGRLSANGSPAVSGDPSADEYELTTAMAAGKGEGLYAASYDVAGNGNRANAGGGGTSNNAGGGGGGNGGRGGFGGWASAASGIDARRGHPGQRIAIDRLLFGGGGGAGHQDNSAGGAGGGGGGVVVLWARRVSGEGSVSANGRDGFGSSIDGAGGGGAGGSIVLVSSSAGGFSGTIAARGGRGGSSPDAHGPGGGGGGGRVELSLPDDFGGDVDAAGGDAGQAGESGSYGATAGSDGTVTYVPLP